MLEQARQHFADFTMRTNRYLQSEPFSAVTKEVRVDTHEDVFKVDVKVIPYEISRAASDCIRDLRAALDQAACESAIAGGQRGKDCAFPFGDTLADVRSCIESGSKELDPRIFSVMESSGPHRGGDDLLWALDKMCGRNAYRLLIPVALAPIKNESEKVSVKSDHPSSVFLFPQYDRQRNEFIMAKFATGSAYEMHYKTHVRWSLSFDEIEILAEMEATEILRTLVSRIEAIISAIEAEGLRIGLFH
ncbi:MAG: hypothetical protein ABI771_15130 [Betaproteobacteria bacterium]